LVSATLLYMFLYKELYFLIHFAEARLAKIEDSIEEKMPQYRIAHLHLNVFPDDMNNRFHESCFNTNRLYLLETSTSSRETQLGISNYREIRKKNKKPREMTDREKILYKAAGNTEILISERLYFILYPIAVLIVLLIFTIAATYVENSGLALLTFQLIITDILSYTLTPPVYHDLIVDLNYAVSSVIFVRSYYKKV